MVIKCAVPLPTQWRAFKTCLLAKRFCCRYPYKQIRKDVYFQ
mgnify:CR=1 FL=1|jgi:hypothetical protein